MEARILPGITPWRVLEVAIFVMIAAAWFYSIRYFGLAGMQVVLYFLAFVAFSFVLRAAFKHLERRFPIEIKLP